MIIPSNDMVGLATRVGQNAVYVLNTGAATTELNEMVDFSASDEGGNSWTFRVGNTVWFRVAPSASGEIGVTTAGSDFDTVLIVYRVTEVGVTPLLTSAQVVAANDDADGRTSAVTFTAQAGTVYYVQAGGYDGASGALSIGFSGLSSSGVFVLGTGEADTLRGVAGQAATMSGLAGADTYVVTATDTRIAEVGGGGFDTVVVTAGVGSYLLNGGAEIELLRAEAGAAPIAIAGNEFSQRIEGNDGVNILSSGGGGGIDTLAGGLGDDTYRVFATGDVIEDTGGFDTVYTSGTSYFLYSTASVEYLSASEQAGTQFFYLVGNGAAQLIVGNWGDNIINGRGGDGQMLPDTLIGLYGNDTYAVFTQGDVVREVAGQGLDAVYANVSYQLREGTEIEVLAAVDGQASDAGSNYTLRGNEFAQTVVGNDAANVLDGRGGSDTLVGRGGADVFAFSVAPFAGQVDTIADFAGGDRIGLSSDVFAAVTDGGIATGEFVLGTAAQDGDDRLLYDQATGRLFYDADANGADAAVLFAQLTPGTVLSAGDFTTIAPVANLPAA